ncbi:unnamed protein product [Chrysodeixis includens]|uniref:UDP-glucuronosyltransferase n=1 Tax=Chrysodeixis includens TaxID=689277 RepID=A0A9P0C0I3_CHRIL|nr:unnamed protein product [Chrysodeixis includens]
MKLIIFLLYFVVNCDCYNILGIFPYNGRSHHIYYSSVVEELIRRGHTVTVINYHPMPKLPTLLQISLQDEHNASDNVNIEEQLKVLSHSDLSMAYDSAQAFKYLANTNCKKLVHNKEVQELIRSSKHFDLVIVEQFVTDCGLAIAHKLNAPTIGMTAHILMSWTYSRLGAPNHPAYVPNHYFACGTKPNFFNRIKSVILNFGMNLYYTHVIQSSDQEIVNEVYPGVPPLEDLARNISLIAINQYFPLTGSRLFGANVIEVGGIHIKANVPLEDKALKSFLDAASDGAVYVSFGSVASNFPKIITSEIIKWFENSKMRFVWKTDIKDWKPPSNVFVSQWIAQVPVLCHPNVVAFVSHSGMLSTSEAMHCGVPIVGVPLFGDQFANGQSAVESGLGVTVDVVTLSASVLEDAVTTILSEKYQKQAKKLSQLWKDRPLSPMDTAIFWMEYVARHQTAVDLKPPTTNLPFYQYIMIDVILVLGSVLIILIYIVVKIFKTLLTKLKTNTKVKETKRSNKTKKLK